MGESSLKQKILEYVRNNGKMNGGQIERFAEALGYKASNASRRARELHNEGLLRRELIKGKGVASVWYSPTTPTTTTEYRLPNGELIYTKKDYE